MPLNRYVVRVDPQGQSVTVDILDTSGVSVVVYDTSQFAAVPRTLPMVITAQTDFWLHNPGPYDVSCKVGGAEVADAGAPERVQVSDVPVLVVPDWERERTASPGGSSLIEFIATGADGNALPDGTDYYPDMTQVASVGVGISLGVDNQTFTLAAGTYDLGLVCGVLPTTDAGTLTVFFDGLPAPFDSPLITPARQATLCVFPVTIDGLILAAPTTTKLNLEHDGGGVFSIAKLHLCIRKVA